MTDYDALIAEAEEFSRTMGIITGRGLHGRMLAALKELAPKADRIPTKTIYRALYDGGKLWCESWDQFEVISQSPARSHAAPFTFERLDIYVEEQTDGWQPWKEMTK